MSMNDGSKKKVSPTLTRGEAVFWLNVWAVDVSGRPFARAALRPCVEGFLKGQCVVIWRDVEKGERMTALAPLPTGGGEGEGK